ncbi:MAG: DUF1178 family protein [Pseudomonadota bacterium]
MIKYSLRCAKGHAFDSWFASASAYDSLAQAGRLTCAVCGCTEVEKALMTPRVRAGRGKEEAPKPPVPAGAAQPAKAPSLAEPASDFEAAVAEFRAKVEATTEDVGQRFADEARAIHEGRAPDRAIRGEAKIGDARALAEDGVPVLPLPFPAPRQVN